MKSMLTIERREIEQHLRYIDTFLMRYAGHIGQVRAGEASQQSFMRELYDGFCQYLYLVHSHTLGNPDAYYLMDEHFYGQQVAAEDRDVLAELVSVHFANAAMAVQGVCQLVVDRMEYYGEEVEEVTYHFPNIHIVCFVIETAPFDQSMPGPPPVQATDHYKQLL